MQQLNIGVLYVAIRRPADGGRDYPDLLTISGDIEVCRERADKNNKAAPAWAAANPVVRFALANLIEVP